MHSVSKSHVQWARTNPPSQLSRYQNPGWPGCCRPPASSEQRWIHAADWLSVSMVHHVPIPPDIKALLHCLPIKHSVPATHGRSISRRLILPELDRRNSRSSSPSQKSNPTLTKTPIGTASGLLGGNPQPSTVPLGTANSRGSGPNLAPHRAPSTFPSPNSN